MGPQGQAQEIGRQARQRGQHGGSHGAGQTGKRYGGGEKERGERLGSDQRIIIAFPNLPHLPLSFPFTGARNI